MNTYPVVTVQLHEGFNVRAMVLDVLEIAEGHTISLVQVATDEEHKRYLVRAALTDFRDFVAEVENTLDTVPEDWQAYALVDLHDVPRQKEPRGGGSPIDFRSARDRLCLI